MNSFTIQKAITTTKLFQKIKLSMPAKLVLRTLVDYYNPQVDFMFPGQKRLAEECDLNRETVINALKELEIKGLIISNFRTGSSKTYAFTIQLFILLKESDKNKMSAIPTSGVGTADFRVSVLPTQTYNIKDNLKKGNFKNLKNDVPLISAEENNKLQNYLRSLKNNTGSPLDMDFPQACEYVFNLPPILKNSYWAQELRKKWNICDEEIFYKKAN